MTTSIPRDEPIAEGFPVALEHDEEEEQARSDQDMTAAYDEGDQTTTKLHATPLALKTAEIEREAVAREAELRAQEEASLASFRAALELKRQKTREAQLAHEETVVQAVCAASRLEYSERQRIEAQAEADEKRRQEEEAAQLESIAASKSLAKQSKTVAVQSVLDLKSKAHQAKVQARKAIEEYEAKERERQEKLAALAETEGQRELELQLEAMKQRQEAATLKRLESERRANEAMERAQALRQSALDAAKHLRQTAKQGITAVLESEDKARAAHYASELQAVQAAKDEASRRREESERRAAEAAQRAAALREQAANAANELRSVSKRGIAVVVEKDEGLQHDQVQIQLSKDQSECAQAVAQVTTQSPSIDTSAATPSPAIDAPSATQANSAVPSAATAAPAPLRPSSSPLPLNRSKSERKKKKCVIM